MSAHHYRQHRITFLFPCDAEQAACTHLQHWTSKAGINTKLDCRVVALEYTYTLLEYIDRNLIESMPGLARSESEAKAWRWSARCDFRTM